MSSPLDDHLATLGLAPVVPRGPTPPSFSVVIRTQGRRPGSLAEALASVEAQTLSAVETIVIVHGAPETVEAVRATLGARDGLEVAGIEGGRRGRPLNAGLEIATGDYVCFLDDDDLARPAWLATFARGASEGPGTVVRAVTASQDWTTDGGEEPVRATSPVTHPFPDHFDLLAHLSRNDTPNCSVAFPRAVLETFGLRVDETLPVFEDWEFLMRVAMTTGVTSVPESTTLYRRLDHGNADTAEREAVWHETHARVIDLFSSRPVVLPAGDARRVASAHFRPDGGSRHEDELATAMQELDRVTRSPLRWARVFGQRATNAVRHRVAAPRP